MKYGIEVHTHRLFQKRNLLIRRPSYFADVSIFCKISAFFGKIVVLLKAIVWELRPSSVFSFCKIKGEIYWKCKFYRLCVYNLAFELLQIGHKLEKWQCPHNFFDLTSSAIFFDIVLFLLLILVTGPSLMPMSSLILELWQFTYVRHWPKI